MNIKVQVIAAYYKETYLIPLFMEHYENWTDEVTLITTRWPDDKLDDGAKIDLINRAIERSDADWVIVVDADEYIFPKGGDNPRTTLERETGDICNCEMLRVWRHMSDQDVDRMKPPLLQRRHGGPDHVKPCIFRPRGVKIQIGTHGATFPTEYKWGKPWSAVHWANADPEFGIQRTHRDRQTRLSENNYKHGWGMIPEWLDPNYLKDLYAKHLDDPFVI
jgi:hypothetical protein